jgi:hypothetical protein
MADKPPKPPKVSAPKEEHKRFAREVERYEPYGQEPPGGVTIDEVPLHEQPPVTETDD